MALCSLARGTCGPAASALRRRPGAGMSTVACSRLQGTTRNQAQQRSNGTRKETADEKAFLDRELDKVLKVLRQRNEDLEKLKGEIRRVVKIYAVSAAGISGISLWFRWSKHKSTQMAVQGTSH